MRIKPRNPVNYDLCRQTVTVYHKEGTGYTRKVYDRAFYNFQKNWSVNKTGSQETNSFLLVIPGSEQAAFVGDKVVEGVGPIITSPEEWLRFNPKEVPGLSVIRHVDTPEWDGKIVHTEAGG